LLIDEVTEIPLETQSKILRVLTDQKFKRINGTHDIKVDVRIICSTNKDIYKEMKMCNFREDLFHRLNVFNINIEPLSKRLEDVPHLVEYFSEQISKNYNPENKIEAIKKIQQSEQQGKVLTGLLYINPKAKDLKEILHVVDTPLNKLVERDLCPGKEKINQINSSLK
jgi:DNA-binding NtrC family response regulator